VPRLRSRSRPPIPARSPTGAVVARRSKLEPRFTISPPARACSASAASAGGAVLVGTAALGYQAARRAASRRLLSRPWSTCTSGPPRWARVWVHLNDGRSLSRSRRAPYSDVQPLRVGGSGITSPFPQIQAAERRAIPSGSNTCGSRRKAQRDWGSRSSSTPPCCAGTRASRGALPSVHMAHTLLFDDSRRQRLGLTR
jgi:hypothetical protein